MMDIMKSGLGDVLGEVVLLLLLVLVGLTDKWALALVRVMRVGGFACSRGVVVVIVAIVEIVIIVGITVVTTSTVLIVKVLSTV